MRLSAQGTVAVSKPGMLAHEVVLLIENWRIVFPPIVIFKKRPSIKADRQRNSFAQASIVVRWISPCFVAQKASDNRKHQASE